MTALVVLIADDVVASLHLCFVAIKMDPVHLSLLILMFYRKASIVSIVLGHVFCAITKFSFVFSMVDPFEHVLIVDGMVHQIVVLARAMLHGKWLICF